MNTLFATARVLSLSFLATVIPASIAHAGSVPISAGAHAQDSQLLRVQIELQQHGVERAFSPRWRWVNHQGSAQPLFYEFVVEAMGPSGRARSRQAGALPMDESSPMSVIRMRHREGAVYESTLIVQDAQGVVIATHSRRD